MMSKTMTIAGQYQTMDIVLQEYATDVLRRLLHVFMFVPVCQYTQSSSESPWIKTVQG